MTIAETRNCLSGEQVKGSLQMAVSKVSLLYFFPDKTDPYPNSKEPWAKLAAEFPQFSDQIYILWETYNSARNLRDEFLYSGSEPSPLNFLPSFSQITDNFAKELLTDLLLSRISPYLECEGDQLREKAKKEANKMMKALGNNVFQITAHSIVENILTGTLRLDPPTERAKLPDF